MNSRVIILVVSLFLFPSFTLAESDHPRERKGMHEKDGMRRPNPYKRLLVDHCKESPSDAVCDKMRKTDGEMKEQMAQRRKFCQENPTEEKCVKMHQMMEQRKAKQEEMRAKCESNPEECRLKRMADGKGPHQLRVNDANSNGVF